MHWLFENVVTVLVRFEVVRVVSVSVYGIWLVHASRYVQICLVGVVTLYLLVCVVLYEQDVISSDWNGVCAGTIVSCGF